MCRSISMDAKVFVLPDFVQRLKITLQKYLICHLETITGSGLSFSIKVSFPIDHLELKKKYCITVIVISIYK